MRTEYSELSGVWDDVTANIKKTVVTASTLPEKALKLPGRVFKDVESGAKLIGKTGSKAVSDVGDTAKGISSGLIFGALALAALVLFTQKDTIGSIAKKHL